MKKPKKEYIIRLNVAIETTESVKIKIVRDVADAINEMPKVIGVSVVEEVDGLSVCF
jgi:hypothetical protein